MISPSYCSTISRATESPTPGRDAGYQPAGRGRKRPGAGSAGSPAHRLPPGMCRWLSVVWRTETSTNSEAILTGVIKNVTHHFHKIVLLADKSDLRRDVERDIDPFALIDLVESGSQAVKQGGRSGVIPGSRGCRRCACWRDAGNNQSAARCGLSAPASPAPPRRR